MASNLAISVRADTAEARAQLALVESDVRSLGTALRRAANDAREADLGSVEIHRELMTAAARWIMAWKLWSVLSARRAMRLKSLSLQKKFSIR